MKRELKITVNGDLYDLHVEPGTLLVEVLRDKLGLTGTKRGCDSMSCGACTVILNGKAVKSCTILALQANGKEVTTVEGLANGSRLHPIQQSFIDHWAFQCGFCTSGQIMAAKALLDENPNPTRKEIKYAMNGHLCRCTGYNMIIEAILDAANRIQEEAK
jgi:aerobic-type carbon monoxide dehydrogenase small subunit (CoxS/CutS family)